MAGLPYAEAKSMSKMPFLLVLQLRIWWGRFLYVVVSLNRA